MPVSSLPSLSNPLFGRPTLARIPGLISRPISPALFTLAVSTGFLIFYNRPLWTEVLGLTAMDGHPDWIFATGMFLNFLVAMNAILTLAAWPGVIKPLAIFLVLVSAGAAYFMATYGVLIDREMIRNMVETDWAETQDLLTLRLLVHSILWAALPIWIIQRQPLRFSPWRRELGQKGQILLVSLAIILTSILIQFPQYAAFFRIHRHVRHMVTPVNALYAASSFAKRTYFNHPAPLHLVGEDAVFVQPVGGGDSKRLVFVLVIGETARAANFSLQGYPRPTNPELTQAGGVYFSQTTSCGTSTAASLPCLFSAESHASFSHYQNNEGLLDVLTHAGAQVLWRDNNSGCKGACERVATEDLTESNDPRFCAGAHCFDEILLAGLEGIMAQGSAPLVIVLHQVGSHGPAYFKRYPPPFRRFTPTCDQTDIGDCDRQSIVNAYDNTILYTDHVLGELIALLKRNQDRYQTAMLYVSDHGESLGENNIYLHGLPYAFAPEGQTHVPLYLWLSPSFGEAQGLDPDCLTGLKDEPISHDNLFHTVLGLLNVRTAVRDPRLDLTAACRGERS